MLVTNILGRKPYRAQIISVIWGVPFIGLEDHIYEEVPTVYIDNSILGLQIVLQGAGGELGYTLKIRSHIDNDEPDDASEIELDITGYVSCLFERTDQIKIKCDELITRITLV
jgi:hypothetical protein